MVNIIVKTYRTQKEQYVAELYLMGFARMNSGTKCGSDDKKINIMERYMWQEIEESRDWTRPERTRYLIW